MSDTAGMGGGEYRGFSLPPGMTIDPSTGTISGIPSEPGTHTFTVQGPDLDALGRVKWYASEDDTEELRCVACEQPAGAGGGYFLHGGGQPTLHAGCAIWHWLDGGHFPGGVRDEKTIFLNRVTCPLCLVLPEYRGAVRRERWRRHRAMARRVLAYPYRRLWPARERASRWLYPYPRDGEDG